MRTAPVTAVPPNAPRETLGSSRAAAGAVLATGIYLPEHHTDFGVAAAYLGRVRHRNLIKIHERK